MVLGLALLGGSGWPLLPQALAAQTNDPSASSTTVIVLTVAAGDQIRWQSSFTEHPPTISIRFPKQHVISSLPERTAVGRGVVQSLTARYDAAAGSRGARFLDAVDIALSGPYAYRVRSQNGRVIVEIDHPASVGSAAMEIGLTDGAISSPLITARVSERFRAMQEALARATPTPWTFQVNQPAAPGAFGVAALAQARSAKAAPRPLGAPWTPRSAPRTALAMWIGLISLAGWWLLRRALPGGWPRKRAGDLAASSGVKMLDELAWKTFERQGYEVVSSAELTKPLAGSFRVIAKQGESSAWFVAGHGAFYDKQTVQRFLSAMQSARVARGFLIAPGSFTVPAQRFASEHQIQLIGREQLTELLSLGAQSETASKQVETLRAQLEEINATLARCAQELDDLRRQRNEASWFLGEERTRSASLEAQLQELSDARVHDAAARQQAETDAMKWHKQWEESQWYLGESRTRVAHLEDQLAILQDLSSRLETAEREAREASWFLGEERVRTEALEAQVATLQRALDEAQQGRSELQAMMARLTKELTILRTVGERRASERVTVPAMAVELRLNGGESIVSGACRNMSGGGISLEADRALPTDTSCRLRLSLPGQEPFDSTAKIKWQRTLDTQPVRYQSGFQFTGLNPSKRQWLKQLLAAASQPASK
ncbi:MAG: PilZ domain-containing protein [Candidatus Omnitrophica bacterium]|nr:PilZ domain-containing protein [Candidatus Omnitrophota bacterium]